MRPFYFLRRAIGNILGAPLPAFATFATIAVAVFLGGALFLTGTNLRGALLGWASSSDHVIVYAEIALESDPRLEELASRIRAVAGVEAVRRISPEEGFAELETALGESVAILDGIEPREVLPTVFTVSVSEEAISVDRLEGIATSIEDLAGVESVESDRLWLERYSALASMGRWIVVGWSALLGTGALLVIASSARLAAYTRRQELEVLRLVGASDGFVIAPFVLEGALEGAAGAAAALVALAAGWAAARAALSASFPMLGDVEFLGREATLVLLATGPVLGAFGSGASARRFLRQIPL